MFRQILCQIFSNQCQLTSLSLDIRKAFYSIHQCLESHSYASLSATSNGIQSYCCTSLRSLKIYLDYTCFLEDLIDRVPNLEELSVICQSLQRHCSYSNPNIQNAILSNEGWFNKVQLI